MRPLIAITLAAFAAGAFAQDTYRIALKPVEGRVRTMVTHATIEVMGMEIEIDAEAEVSVAKVNDDGSFIEKIKTIKAVQRMNDQSMEQPGGEEQTVTRDAKGRPIKRDGGQMDENSAKISAVVNFVPPSEEVKVGQTWEQKEPANEATMAPATNHKYTLKAVEDLEGVQVYVLDFEIMIDEENPMGGKGTLWVEADSGEVAKMDAKLVNATIQGMQAEGTIHATSKKKG